MASTNLTLSIKFLQQPVNETGFGYTIVNNGVPITYINGSTTVDKLFKDTINETVGRIIGLNTDLNLQSDYNFGSGFDGEVYNIVKQSTGKFVVVGQITSYNGVPLAKQYICRLNADLTIDSTFNPPFFPNIILGLLVDSNDKLYCRGMSTISGHNSLIKLNADGTIDTSYQIGYGFHLGTVRNFKLDASGNLIVIGSFTHYASSTTTTARDGIIRLLPSGQNDTSFLTTGSGFIGIGAGGPQSLALMSDGKIVIGGNFTGYNSSIGTLSVTNLIVLNTNGTGAYASSAIQGAATGYMNVTTVAVDNSDLIYVSGYFNKVGTATRNKIARLNLVSGTYRLDSGYQIGSGLDLPANVIKFDGTYIYMGGEFTTFGSSLVNHLCKTDMTAGFIIGADTGAFNNTVNDILFIGTDMIYVGNFTNYTNSVVTQSQKIIPIGTTTSDTLNNTYDNLIAFNNYVDITYTKVGNDITVTYNYDDSEYISVPDVRDIPGFVEITYSGNISLVNFVKELRVRSSYLVITPNLTPYDTTDYKISIWEGDITTPPTVPTYLKTKTKISPLQTNIYINISNLVRENLEADISYFGDPDYTTARNLSTNESKWVEVDSTNSLTGTTLAGATKLIYFITDGFIENNDPQILPLVLISNTTNNMERNSNQRLYFKTNDLTSVSYNYDNDPRLRGVNITGDTNNNYGYVKSIKVDNQSVYNAKWVEYTLHYGSDILRVGHKFRFYFYDECKFKTYDLVFKNKYGVLQSLSMNKKTNKSLRVTSEDYLRSIVDINGSYDINRHTGKQFNVDSTEEWVLNTDFIPEYMNNTIRELMLTEELWVVDNNTAQIIPVVKVDDILNYKTQLNDKLIQYTIKVRMSHSSFKNII